MDYDFTYTGAEIQAILDTGKKLKDSGYIFLGVATPSTNPGTPTQKVYYEAKQAGTYTNFGGVVLPDGMSLLIWNGSWTSETVMCGDGGVFDISVYKSTGGTLATYADLAAALDGGNNIPVGVRKGGMSVKFVQSSDNKYVQFRLMAQDFTINEADWQGVDDEPKESDNLIKSKGVFVPLHGNVHYSGSTTINAGASKKTFTISLVDKDQYCEVIVERISGDALTSGTLEFDNDSYVVLESVAVNIGQVVTTLIPAGCTKVVFVNENETALQSNTKVSLIIRAGGIYERLDTDEYNIKDNKIKIEKGSIKIFDGKTISVVGDAISTYTGYIGENVSFYPYDNVDSVEKTWWYKFIQRTNGVLGENNSYDNARVSNGAQDIPSLVTQVGGVDSCDVLLLAGGQYDSQNNVEIGTLDFDKETSQLDDSKFADAYDHYVRVAMTKASKVICVITSILSEPYRDVIKKVAKHYSLDYCDLTSTAIPKAITAHPNYEGMMMMTECVISCLYDNGVKHDLQYLFGRDEDLSAVEKRLNSDDYYNDRIQYSDFQSIDVTKIGVYRGAINNDSGEVTSHAKNAYTDFISVKPLSRFSIKSLNVNGVYLRAAIRFYRMNDNGTWTYQGQYGLPVTTASLPYEEIAIPPTVNAVRFYLVMSDNSTVPLSISNSQLELKGHICSIFKAIGNVYTDIVNNGIIRAEEIEWLQGNMYQSNPYTVYSYTTCTTTNLFKVNPGQRIIIDRDIESKCYVHNILEYGNPTSAYLYDNRSGDIIQNRKAYIVPVGVNYIRIVAVCDKTAGGQDITPEECATANWHIIESSGNLNCPSSKLIHKHVTGEQAGWTTPIPEWVGGTSYAYNAKVIHDNEVYRCNTPNNYDDWQRERVIDGVVTRIWIKINYAQGGAIMNGYLFQGWALGWIDVWDLSTDTCVGSFQVPVPSGASVDHLHINVIQIGGKYDDNDEFNMVWIEEDGDVNGCVIGLRIIKDNDKITYDTDHVINVTLPELDDEVFGGRNIAIDFVSKRLNMMCHKIYNGNTFVPSASGIGDIELKTYSYTGDFEDGNFTLIKSFDYNIFFTPCGALLKDAYLYSPRGNGNQLLYVFNVLKGELEKVYDLERSGINITEESQAIIQDGDVYIDTVRGVYKVLL